MGKIFDKYFLSVCVVHGVHLIATGADKVTRCDRCLFEKVPGTKHPKFAAYEITKEQYDRISREL